MMLASLDPRPSASMPPKEADPRTADADRDPRKDDLATAFAALIGTVSQANLQNQVQVDAGQMFEAKSSDPRATEKDGRHLESDGSDNTTNDVADDSALASSAAVQTRPNPKNPAAPAGQNKPTTDDRLPGPSRMNLDPPGASKQPAERPASSPLDLRPESTVTDGTSRADTAPAPIPTVAAATVVQAPTNLPTSSPAQQVAEILRGSLGPDGPRAGADAKQALAPASSTARPDAPRPKPPGPPSTSQTARQSAAPDSQRVGFQELVKSLRLQLGARQSSARLRLDPPELGHIRVDLKVSGDRVQIGVQAQTDAARDILAGRADQLKNNLESHGIRVESFEIVLNQSPDQSTVAFTTADHSPVRPQSIADAPRPTRDGEDSKEDENQPPKRTRSASALSTAPEARLDVQG